MMTQPHDIRTAPLDEVETWARDQDPATAALVDRLAKAERENAEWDDLPADLPDFTPAGVADYVKELQGKLDDEETRADREQERADNAEQEADGLRDQLAECQGGDA